MLRLEQGDFGFIDVYGARLRGSRKLTCEMTLRDGKILYELNGLSRPDWTTLPKNYKATGSPRWDGTRSSNGLPALDRLDAQPAGDPRRTTELPKAANPPAVKP